MTPNPQVSIIILNYNGKEFMRRCLESVLRDAYEPKEIILVDNASRDGSMDLAQSYADRLQMVFNPRNYGFPLGCHQGTRIARGDILVLLNIDTEVTEGWLEALVRPLCEDAAIGLTASKLLFPDRKTIQFAGGAMHANGLTAHEGYGCEDQGQFDTPRDCDYLTGASLAIRRDAWEALGGMDEGFPLYFEDLDLCTRAHRLGYRTLYQPRSVVYHFETFGTQKNSPRYYYQYHRGRLRFILKHFGLTYFFRTFLPAERNWRRQADLDRQGRALRLAYFTQLPKAPYFWVRGFIQRRIL